MSHDVRDYLDIERAFGQKLISSWRAIAPGIFQPIAEAVRDRQFGLAYDLAKAVDLSVVAKTNREFIKYMLLSAGVYGAKNVHEADSTVLAVGAYDQFLGKVADNFVRALAGQPTTDLYNQLVGAIHEAENVRPLQSIAKFNENHDELGRFASGGGGVAMYSPKDTPGSRTFGEAVSEVSSPGYEGFLNMAKTIQQKLGLGGDVQTAIGDTQEWGTEESAFTTAKAVDYNRLLASAAMEGYAHNQLNVAVFKDDKDGPNSLYQWEVPHGKASLEDLRSKLDELGVPFRTFVPGKDSTKVVVIDTTGELKDKAQQFSSHYEEHFDVYRGHAQFLGNQQETGSDDEKRISAREEYAKIIEGLGKTDERIQDTWNWVQHGHARKSEAQEAGEEIRITKFNPNHDERGRFSSGTHYQPRADAASPKFVNDVIWALRHGGQVQLSEDDAIKVISAMGSRDDHPNIMGMHIRNTELFGGLESGIDRESMPQIPQAMRDTFLEELRAEGIRVESEAVDPLKLRPTQNQLNGQKVGDMLNRLNSGKFKPMQPIIISQDSHIIDGHHTWATFVLKRLKDSGATIATYRIYLNQKDLHDAAQKFTDKHGIERKHISKALQESIDNILETVRKFNPNHDDLGRFATGDFQSYMSGDEDSKNLVYDTSDNQWDALTATERKVVLAYTGAMSSYVNTLVSDPEAFYQQDQDHIDYDWVNKHRTEIEDSVAHLRSAISKSTIPKDMLVYRGANLRRVVVDGKPKDLKDWVGRDFFDPQFASTSIFEEQGQKFVRDRVGRVLLHIEVPRGSNGLLVLDNSHANHEGEVILPDHSKFHVIGVGETKGGASYLRVRLLPRTTHVQKKDTQTLTALDLLSSDDNARFVDKFVSFTEDGDRSLQLIASLHTNRLAVWGFTAEAEVTGYTRYRIRAILDNRVCPFCEQMHGRTFDVATARRLITRALSVDNPDDISTIQPWPDQSKAPQFAAMTDEELQGAGYFVPPFHPWDRCICVKVESSYEVQSLPVADVGAGEADVQPPTAENFAELGIALEVSELQTYNRVMHFLDPVRVTSQMTGESPSDILAGSVAVGITLGALGVVDFDLVGELGGGTYDLTQLIDPANQRLVQALMTFEGVSAEDAAQFVLNLYANDLDIAAAVGGEIISVQAGSKYGAYTYAQLGFTPSSPVEWKVMAGEVLNALVPGGRLSAAIDQLTADQLEVVRDLLGSSELTAIWALSDLPFEVNGLPVGQYLLDNRAADMVLDITNATARLAEFPS